MRGDGFAVTDDDVAAFERDGVVCLRGVLPGHWIERLAAAAERVIDAAGTVDLTAFAGKPPAEDGSRRRRFHAGTDHWVADADFRAFACESPLPAVAARLLRSSRVNLYEDSVLVKEPGAEEATVFHQDLGYFHVTGEQVCTFWCPLDPATSETGTVGFVPGSHRWDRLFRPTLFVTRDALPGTEGEDAPDVGADPGRYGVVSFDMAPGDVTVHHVRTLHGAGPNRSPDRRRRAVSVRYCGDDARFHARPGAPMKPYQATMREGERLDRPECPLVFDAAAGRGPS